MSDDFAHSNHVGHVVPLKLLLGILAVLLFLTFITVYVTNFDFGQFNLVVAMLIATVKASLVLLYFMHLRWDRPFNAVVIIFSIVLVALFVILAMADSVTYQPNLVPGYAPDLEQ